MKDEQIQTKRDVRRELADRYNTKAALGDHTPGMDMSVEQQVTAVINKIFDSGWGKERVVQEICNRIPGWAKILTPFIELRGPKR